MSDDADITDLTADIVSSYVSNSQIRPEELPGLIGSVHAALKAAQRGSHQPEPKPLPEPAVPVRKSVTPDYIICLEDGENYKSLRRHLNSRHNMTPDEYRERWGLKSDYPMVAPNYSEARSDLAKSMGLGKRRSAEEAEAAPEAGVAPKRRSRATKSDTAGTAAE